MNITYAEYKNIEAEAEQLQMVAVFDAPDVTGPDCSYVPNSTDFIACFLYQQVEHNMTAEMRTEDLANQKFLDILAGYI